jgi:hypothetical protein
MKTIIANQDNAHGQTVIQWIAFIATTALLAYSGCGEDDNISGSSAGFEGTWSGTFSGDGPGDDSGTWSMTVGDDGAVSGSGVSILDGNFGLTSGTGRVDADGGFVVGAPQTDNPRNWSGTFSDATVSGFWVDPFACNPFIVPVDPNCNPLRTGSGTFTGSKN